MICLPMKFDIKVFKIDKVFSITLQWGSGQQKFFFYYIEYQKRESKNKLQ